MKYYIAVYQKLKEIFESQSTGENDVTLLCPSLRLYEKEDLELLKPQSLLLDNGKIPEAIIKKQQFSYELNTVPISNNYWDLNPNNSLFDIYREILNKVEVKNLLKNLESLDTTDNKILYANKKETAAYKAYLKYLDLYEKKVDELSEHFTTYDSEYTNEQKANWQEKYMILKDKSELALAELKVKGFKNIIEKAIDQVNEVSKNEEFLNYLQSVKNSFDSMEKTDVTTLSAIHDINFIPYDFMDNESGWSNLKMEKAELDLFFANAKKNAANYPTEIFSIDYDEAIITGIELDYSFVHLKRAWFNKEIFNSEYFSWNDTKLISDGVSISNQFRLSAFPKIMILIKNLRIKLDTKISENQVNNPNQLIYFGPLLLKQQLFINKNTNEKFLKAVTNNKVLKSDQYNYMKRKSVSSEVILNETQITQPITPVAPKVENPIIARRTSLGVAGNNTRARVATNPNTVISTINPATFTKVKLNPKIFIPVNIPLQPTKAKIFLNVNDFVSKEGVKRPNLIVKGTDNSGFLVLEGDDDGKATFEMPIGNYTIEFQTDDYEFFQASFKVESTNPLTLTYLLKREQISYKSYFLIGMVCEKIVKTPKIN